MSTKERLLKLLVSNHDEYISGEEIANRLNISRAAVWKAANVLRNEGIEIEAVRNRGYRIGNNYDVLSLNSIRSNISGKCDVSGIKIVKTVDSTNSYLKRIAQEYENAKNLVIIADEQTNGRGRMGRKFYSPQSSGIYMSILLRPEKCTMEKSLKYTTMAASAVCSAIENVTDTKPVIKWVNDIYIGGKKVCGILTEGYMNMENGLLDHAVLGIGLNLYEPDEGFPDELKSIAGNICNKRKHNTKNMLTAQILNNFYNYFDDNDEKKYLNYYRSKSMVIGKQIEINYDGKNEQVTVTDIDDDCALLAVNSNGEKRKYKNGEVRIRSFKNGIN